jgi:hypothetical protein
MGDLYDDFIDTLDAYTSTTLIPKLTDFCNALGFKKKEGEEFSKGTNFVTIEVESNTDDRRMFATITDKDKGRLVVTDAEVNILDIMDFQLNNDGDEWYEC